MKLTKLILLFFPFVLSTIMKIIILFGFIRLRFEMNEELEINLGYVVTTSSRWLNQYWDVVLERQPEQPHHTAIDLFSSAFNHSLKTLKFLFFSLFTWKK